MSTVTYTFRSFDNRYTLQTAEIAARGYLAEDLKKAVLRGYEIREAGNNFFTATNPVSGLSLTCTITH